MSDETKGALSQAFEAIEAGDLDAARGILEPILEVEPDNADAWWVYSHALTDPEQAQTALENVVRINPNYPQAAELLNTLRQRLPRQTQRPTVVSAPSDLPLAEEPDFDLESTPPSGMRPVTTAAVGSTTTTVTNEEEPRRSWIPLVAGILLVGVIAALLLSILSQQGGTPTPTSAAVSQATLALETPMQFTLTDEASLATAEATQPEQGVDFVPEGVGVETTDEVAVSEVAVSEGAVSETTESQAATSEAGAVEVTDESPLTLETPSALTPAAPDAISPTQVADAGSGGTGSGGTGVDVSQYASVLSGMARFTLASEAVTEQETTLGTTAVVNVCVADRREVTSQLRPVMRALARGASSVETDAIGVRMLNCETGTPFVTMVVDRQSAIDHAAGALSYVDFRDRWQPQR